MKRLISLPIPWTCNCGATATIATVSRVGMACNVGATALLCNPTQTAQLPEPLAIRACGWECVASSPLKTSTNRMQATAVKRSSKLFSNWALFVTSGFLERSLSGPDISLGCIYSGRRTHDRAQ